MPILKTVKITNTPKGEAGEPWVSQIIHYDRQGRELANYQYAAAGIFESKTENRYDENGNLIEETTYQDEHEIAERKTYHLNDAGEPEKISIDFNDGSQSFRIRVKEPEKRTETWIEQDEEGEQETRECKTMDAEGRLLVRELYDHRDRLTEAFDYEYDNSNQVIRRRQFDNRKKLVIETRFSYTPGGLLELRANYNRKGQLSDFIKIEYDDQGRVFRQNISNKYFFEFEYDQNGNTVVEERYTGEELEHRTTYEYDANNRVIHEEHADMTRLFTYEYYED